MVVLSKRKRLPMFLLFVLCISAAGAKPHAIYVSVTSVYFKQGEMLPSVRIRLFFDDLQRCAQEEWGLEERPPLPYFTEEGGMQRYVDEHIKLQLDQQDIRLHFDRVEADQDDAISVYLKAELLQDEFPDEWSEIWVFNDFFVEQIEAQKNLVRIRYGSMREFFNLDKDRRELQLAL